MATSRPQSLGASSSRQEGRVLLRVAEEVGDRPEIEIGRDHRHVGDRACAASVGRDVGQRDLHRSRDLGLVGQEDVLTADQHVRGRIGVGASRRGAGRPERHHDQQQRRQEGKGASHGARA